MKRLPSQGELSALLICGVVSGPRIDGWALGKGQELGQMVESFKETSAVVGYHTLLTMPTTHWHAELSISYVPGYVSSIFETLLVGGSVSN